MTGCAWSLSTIIRGTRLPAPYTHLELTYTEADLMTNASTFNNFSGIPLPPALGGSSTTLDVGVRDQVLNLLDCLQPAHKGVERRIHHRLPLARLIYLTPVGPDGLTPLGKPIVVVGKHVSEQGLGFFRQQPLPYRADGGLAGTEPRQLGGISDRFALVPLHPARLVRQRRAFAAIGILTDVCRLTLGIRPGA